MTNFYLSVLYLSDSMQLSGRFCSSCFSSFACYSSSKASSGFGPVGYAFGSWLRDGYGFYAWLGSTIGRELCALSSATWIDTGVGSSG